MKKKLSTLVASLLMIAMSAVTFAEGYFGESVVNLFKDFSITEVRADIEMGLKGKEYGADYRAGASKSFREPYAELTIKPFAESEFSIRGSIADREYTDKKQNNVSRDSNTISRELFIGNDWSFGNFRLRPEIGIRKTDYAGYRYSGLKSNTEFRIYPKMDYRFNKNWMVYTRGFYGQYKLDKTGTNPSIEGDKYRLEGGVRYTFNRNNAFSIGYSKEYNEENRFSYNTKLNEIRLRYHWNPTRKLQLQPHVYFGFDGERTHSTRSINTKGGDGTYNKDRVGINGHYYLTNSFTLLFQVHYEWYTDRVLYRDNSVNTPKAAVHKDNWFFNTGFKYSI